MKLTNFFINLDIHLGSTVESHQERLLERDSSIDPSLLGFFTSIQIFNLFWFLLNQNRLKICFSLKKKKKKRNKVRSVII